ncbi:Ryanodine receptor Ryr [candidate division KSB1 bacterium]|nr:Ryanodine receptor Ryr [candidate division KSB1 bacterium]
MSSLSLSTVVAGDASIDWFQITTGSKQSKVEAGEQVLNWQTYPHTRQWIKPGGALLLARFLSASTRNAVLSYSLDSLHRVPPDRVIRSFIQLGAFPYSQAKGDRNKKIYRVYAYNGYDGPKAGSISPLHLNTDDADADLVVLDDSGNGFNNDESAWPAAVKEERSPAIIYKMSWPFAKGKLWEHVVARQNRQLVAVVGVNDLRLGGVHISRRLSWERTVRDFIWQFEHHSSLASLRQCAFLVVRFGVEGAILVSNRDQQREIFLFYDPELGEDDFGHFYPGSMLGIGTLFTATLAMYIDELGTEAVCRGVRRGLLSARELWKCGFGADPDRIDYDYSLPAYSFEENDSIEQILVSSMESKSVSAPVEIPENWSFLDDLAKGGLEQAAAYFVKYGHDPALDRVPMARYRNLRAIDRTEIESYKSIHNLIQEYLDSPKNNKPLAIAVFGSPGSGKSFGVTEVAESVAPGTLEKMEFNLSQFNATDDLISAFHRIRDVSLTGSIPLVFFDEFDSDFNGKLGWLKYFLAPIQDGAFRERETIHPLGKAIFVFAGGTCHTFEGFSNCEQKESDDRSNNQKSFKEVKGPDFVSRLRGFVNIKGPNPVDDDDAFFIIRRALLLRHLLTSKAKHLVAADKTLAIDTGVLRALLRVPVYKHGVRSIVALIEMSMLADRACYEPAALPSRSQMELHVDAEAFYNLVLRDALLSSQIEKIAEALHEKYRRDQKDRKPADDPAMQPWEQLDEKLRESNRAAARDIPAKLEALGYDFEATKGDVKPVSFSDEELERLAKMEHERWNRERIAAGWKPGPRDPERKRSPYLVSWERLTDDVKKWDREAVQGIPRAMADAGFHIYKK